MGKAKAKVFNVLDIQYVLQHRSKMTEKELDTYYPGRIILTKGQKKVIEDMSDEDFESYDDRSMEDCAGLGDSDSPIEKCRYAVGKDCYKPSGLEMECPNVRMWILTGIFPYVASRGSAYWELFEQVTNTKWEGRSC